MSRLIKIVDSSLKTWELGIFFTPFRIALEIELQNLRVAVLEKRIEDFSMIERDQNIFIYLILFIILETLVLITNVCIILYLPTVNNDSISCLFIFLLRCEDLISLSVFVCVL